MGHKEARETLHITHSTDNSIIASFDIARLTKANEQNYSLVSKKAQTHAVGKKRQQCIRDTKGRPREIERVQLKHESERTTDREKNRERTKQTLDRYI